MSTTNYSWTPQHPRDVADLTGDGRADIVGFGADGVWTSLNDGGTGFGAPAFRIVAFEANSGWRPGDHPRFVTDLTGDGHADLLGFGDDGVWVALGNGDGTFAPAQFVLAELGFNKGWRVEDHPRFLADVNGDGRPDIVGFGTDGVWVAINNGAGGFQPAAFVLADFGRASNHDLVVRREIVRDMRPRDRIKHLFVLMLENRSYDHLLGWADIQGTDAANGQPTTADGLKGTEFNTYAGAVYPVTKGAPDVTVAPGHDFPDALEQLGGAEAAYPNGGPYPDISNTGFVSNLVRGNRGGPAEVMRCFDPKHVPVLTQLATEFAVCDRWFSSLPGPTEPNRYFSHAANSNGFDESPSPWQIANASTNHWGGFDVGQHIFDALDDADVEFGIYAGDSFPVVGELDGVSNTWDVDDWDDFLEDIKDPDFDKSFIHLEPQYFASIGDTIGADFSGGNSQHPSGGVAAGERLIKQVYEAIRNSPHWNSSMLIITYDEHGGFYDHVAPGPAKPAGTKGESHGFMFDQLGLRVPAVVISPYIAKGLIEHRELEHCSIIKTVCDLFDVPHLKQGRDLNTICGVLHLAYLREPRTDTPATLHDVIVSDFVPPEPAWRRGDLSDLSGVVVRRVTADGHPIETPATPAAPAAPVPAADQPVWGRQDSFIGTSLRAAAVRYAALEPDRKKEILERAANVQTVGEATAFLNEAKAKVEASHGAPRPTPPSPATPPSSGPSSPPSAPLGGQLDPTDIRRSTRPIIDRRRPGPR
jgi:phospholipase C